MGREALSSEVSLLAAKEGSLDDTLLMMACFGCAFPLFAETDAAAGGRCELLGVRWARQRGAIISRDEGDDLRILQGGLRGPRVLTHGHVTQNGKGARPVGYCRGGRNHKGKAGRQFGETAAVTQASLLGAFPAEGMLLLRCGFQRGDTPS